MLAGGLVIGVLLVPPLVHAELTVLYDTGNTSPLAPLLEVLAADQPPDLPPGPQLPNLGAADLERLLPIQSPGLTPGRVEPRSVEQRFARPFFLIGADSLSRQWLKARRAELRRIGAIGMLVQAETVGDLRLVAELADGLPILPAPASDIATALGLSHYPVLISNQGIEQ
jgi:integrating conjugative element protein (TIGR03765 family)